MPEGSGSEHEMSTNALDQVEEAFDISKVKGATAKWPKARKEPRLDVDHPPSIPETRDGPFQPVEGWKDDEEIGYEGER